MAGRDSVYIVKTSVRTSQFGISTPASDPTRSFSWGWPRVDWVAGNKAQTFPWTPGPEFDGISAKAARIPGGCLPPSKAQIPGKPL